MPQEYGLFANKLINWYKTNRRELPWRKTADPYKIWLSEIILQQTRVDQGLPYYLRFIDRFKTVHELAAAPQEEVLRLWQGLGYYSRARNLHDCAIVVSEKFGGKFPTSYSELSKLKGIGPYTAAAIASIAFKEPVPVVDGNVFRVLGRVFGLRLNIAESKNRKTFFDLADKLIPAEHPDLFNQAVMDFGAMQCTPRKPLCRDCVLASMCYAMEHQAQSQLPVNQKKTYLRERYFNYLVLKCEDFILFRKRPAGDIWEGLYDFYALEEDNFGPEDKLLETILVKVGPGAIFDSLSRTYKHVLTHQRIKARFFKIELDNLNLARKIEEILKLKIIRIDEIDRIPKPRLIDAFLADEKIYLTS